eukprot:3972109-Pleurochrysis_carterae.AAC.2
MTSTPIAEQGARAGCNVLPTSESMRGLDRGFAFCAAWNTSTVQMTELAPKDELRSTLRFGALSARRVRAARCAPPVGQAGRLTGRPSRSPTPHTEWPQWRCALSFADWANSCHTLSSRFGRGREPGPGAAVCATRMQTSLKRVGPEGSLDLADAAAL